MAVQDTAIKLGETIVYLVQVCYYQDADFSIFAGHYYADQEINCWSLSKCINATHNLMWVAALVGFLLQYLIF